MRMFRRAVLFIGSIACTAATEAQSSLVLPVPPGARVRVTAPSLVSPLIANYLEMRGDTVVLVEDRAGRGLWSIPYSEIRLLQLSVGQKHNHTPYIIKGAAIGGAAGFGLGLIFAASIQPSDTSKKFKRITTGAAVGAISAVIGGIVGSRFSAENWSPINLPRRLTFVPSPNGAGIRIELAF
ncbi:MAG: hypothetical protein ACT4P6_05430 [Gemmatimonadaceae bacterium]